MATSWAQETDNNVNYTKLCRLLYDGGTLAVKTVFDGIVPPAALWVLLRTNKHTLQRLKRPTGRVLSQDQWDQLYPPSGAVPKSEDFDITLLFVLLRNICGLTPPATGWDALPAPTDASLEANLVRIKYYRNKVTAHSSKAEVDKTQFEAYWKGISSALLVLGLKQNDIDELKSSPLGEKKYNQLVEFWDLSDEEIKQHLEAIESNTSQIKMTSAEIKLKLCSIDSKLQNTCLESEVDKLAHINYTSLIENNYCRKYHPSTRMWVLEQVEKYIKTTASEAGALIIRAGPGIGKSIIAAKICEIYQNNGLLGGCHFFQHSNSLRNNPRIMLQSIARHLCNTVPGYKAALETKLNAHQGRYTADRNCEELFGILFEEPLSQIKIDHNVVIVIDALDECASQYKEEIEDVLESKLCNLPSWIRFVITTRPFPSCCNLNPAALIAIIESDERNLQDLKTYLEYELVQRNARDLTDKFVSISNGLFLVAYFLLNILDESGKESILNADCFPHGISSVYKHYFKRIQSLIKPYIETSQSEDSFYQMLQAVVASESPIPKEMFYKILHLKRVEEVGPEKIKERNDAVHLLHTIFPVENDHVTVFHKTVTDWLSLNADKQHQFSVSPTSGVEVLAEKSLEVFIALKESKKPIDQPLALSDSEKFAVQFGSAFILSSCSLSESKIQDVIKDITVVAAIVSLYESRDQQVLDDNPFSDNIVKRFLYFLLKCQFSKCTASELGKRKKCFGFWLSIAGDLLLNCETSPLSQAQKKQLRHWLVENKLPHHSFHCITSSLPSPFQEKGANVNLFQVTNGWIAVSLYFFNGAVACIILHLKDDGSFVRQKIFEKSHVVRGVSPDKKYLIITGPTCNRVKLYDVTTFEIIQEYDCPIDYAHSFCIFGDAKQWYIVVATESDPNIYIMDGVNGRLDGTLNIGMNIATITVSQSGNIVIVNKDEPILHKPMVIPFGKADFEKMCCKHYLQPYFSVLPLCNNKCSDDGNYIAVLDNGSYIFHTNNGTLFRRFVLPRLTGTFNFSKIVYLSSSCLIMECTTNNRTVRSDFLTHYLFYNLVNDKLVYCTAPFFSQKPLIGVVVPPQDTDNFISALYAVTGKELVKLEFHCLN